MIYNWSGNNTYGGEKGKYNIVNNYYKRGPATPAKHTWMVNPSSPFGQFFIEGNILDGNRATTNDNWNGGVKAKDLDSVHAKIAFRRGGHS